MHAMLAPRGPRLAATDSSRVRAATNPTRTNSSLARPVSPFVRPRSSPDRPGTKPTRTDPSLLRAVFSVVRTGSSLVPLGTSLAPVRSSLIPVRSSLVPVATSLVPVATSLVLVVSCLDPRPVGFVPRSSGLVRPEGRGPRRERTRPPSLTKFLTRAGTLVPVCAPGSPGEWERELSRGYVPDGRRQAPPSSGARNAPSA